MTTSSIVLPLIHLNGTGPAALAAIRAAAALAAIR